jgi:hypothetical protein
VIQSSQSLYYNFYRLLKDNAEEQTGPLIKIRRRIVEFSRDRVLDLGDPVDWILENAATVNFVMRLTDSLRSDYVVAREIELLKERDCDPEIGWHDIVRFRFSAHGERKPAFGSFGPIYDARVAAVNTVRLILDHNLRGVRRGVHVEDHTNLKSWRGRNDRCVLKTVFRFQSLLDAIYWLLADAVVGEPGMIRKCLNCGRFFLASHGREKYCPQKEGLQGISPCANRYRVRRHREKKKRAAAESGAQK